MATSFGMSAKNNPRDIKGRVFDETGAPMPYVTVALLSLPDSTIVGGTTTDTEGIYTIQTELNKGLLMFSMLGYDDVYVDFEQSKEIRMRLSDLLLGEAVVKATMPKTKLTGDGMITSIKGSVLENVGTANDALARVPGLIRSQSGLEVIGKGSPLIYINGRKVNDGAELERLQSYEIQSIEVINNPGAQYDASVKSVVRIRTIRRQGEGFGFNMGLTDEQSLRYKENNDPSAYLNANYRHGTVDIFAGGNYRVSHNVQDSKIYQETRGETVFSQEGTLLFKDIQKGWGANGGVNWQIADNHFVGARVEGGATPRVDVHQVIENDFLVNGVLADHVIAVGDHRPDVSPSSIRTNAYYNGQAGKLGIDFNADYYQLSSSQLAHTDETSTMTESNIVNTLSHTANRLYATKLVLSYPVWQGKLELGTEETFTRNHNDYSIVSDLIPSSESDMAEDNIAFFAQYGCMIPKFGQLSAGLRYEHVNYDYDDKIGSEDLSRKYDNLFPSLAFATQIGPVQGSFSYAVKTQRPDFGQLSSAIRYHSRGILQSGNSKLQPQINHELALNLHWNFITFVTQYARQDNPIIGSWCTLYSDDGMVLLRPENMEDPIRTMASYVNISPTLGIWTMNYTAGLQTQWLELDVPVGNGSSELRHLSFSHRPMWVAQLFNTFNFKHNWRAELGGEYHSKAFNQNSTLMNNYFNLNVAVEKSLLKDNSLVIRLAGADLTGTADYDVLADSGGHFVHQTNTFDFKRVTLSIRYRFNSAQSKYRGTGAGNEAAGRMQ